MIELIDELKAFLFVAKRSTFAGRAKKSFTELGGKEFIYQNGDWRYRDCYFGSLKDIGQEIVLYKNSPLWGMNYFGGIKQNAGLSYKEIEKIFDFLKDALLNLPRVFPVRGPSLFKYSSLTYVNVWSGDITEFTGQEYIFLSDQLVYERTYHGGIIHHEHWKKLNRK